MANSVDPDQMLHSAMSDLGLHCLLRPSVPILRVFTAVFKGLNYRINMVSSHSIQIFTLIMGCTKYIHSKVSAMILQVKSLTLDKRGYQENIFLIFP